MKTILQFNSINSFSTNRLFAEKIQANDLDKFRLLHSNAEVMKTLGGLRDEKQSIENLNWNLKQWDENGFGLWMFYLKDSNEWIGQGGLRRVEVQHNPVVEVGYALMPEFWNQGFATEITAACLEIAFEVIRLDDVVSFTLTTNKASQRVMEKCGLRYERDIIHSDLPHVLYKIKNPRKVELTPYNNQWPVLFEKESIKIKNALGSQLCAIHHIGSTAIPNMPAKPIIDITLECDNLDEIKHITKQLNSLNYYNIRRHIIPHRSFFTRRQDTNISYNLHILERGDPQILRHVHFKDYLIKHPEDAKNYASLKTELAKQHADNVYNYVFGKDNFVQEIDRKAKSWPCRKLDFLPPNTGHKTQDWTPEKIIKAMEANLNVNMTYYAQYIKQVQLIRIPGYTAVNSGLKDDTFNYVLDADFSKNEARTKIQEVSQYFLKNKTPFSWWVCPNDKPDDLTEQLQQAGLVNAENNIGMVIHLDNWQTPTDHTELKIIKVIDKKGLQDFANVLVNNQAAFQQYYEWIAEVYTPEDPIEFYVGYINSKPVTRGLLVYYAQVAGIYWVSTALDERRKGYGSAVEQFLLKCAKEKGYQMAVLQASEEGLPLYLKQGFKKCGIFKEFKPKN